MRELTFEEMEQVGGGSAVKDKIIGWFINKTLDFIWENKEAYWDALIKYTAQYGGLYDPYTAMYRQGS